jgi:hypothetical protein
MGSTAGPPPVSASLAEGLAGVAVDEIEAVAAGVEEDQAVADGARHGAGRVATPELLAAGEIDAADDVAGRLRFAGRDNALAPIEDEDARLDDGPGHPFVLELADGERELVLPLCGANGDHLLVVSPDRSPARASTMGASRYRMGMQEDATPARWRRSNRATRCNNSAMSGEPSGRYNGAVTLSRRSPHIP